MAAEKVGRLRRYKRMNVNGVDPIPSGPNAGFLSDEWVEGMLRINPSGTTSYELEIWSFEDDGGNDWTEDPVERRAIATGVCYTRSFRIRPTDRVTCRITALAGAGAKVDIFWTLA